MYIFARFLFEVARGCRMYAETSFVSRLQRETEQYKKLETVIRFRAGCAKNPKTDHCPATKV
jgi:hypothetical protein